MGKFNFNIQLKQHTPILHFQHQQDGATLRATEVKPKLDRLIHKIMDNTGNKVPKNWLVGGGHNDIKALDYKLKIKAENVETDYLVASSLPRFVREQFDDNNTPYINNAPYFADNERIKNKKLSEARRARMSSGVKLEFFSFNTDILSKIEEWLPVLLAYENFGLRQSKGFGGFFIEGKNSRDFETAIKKHPDYKGALHYRVRNGNVHSIFKKIDNEYKILKSGFLKEPSQMMEYFEEQHDIEWEKPTIKRELVKGRGIPRRDNYSSDEKVKYIRALLGVAELYEYPKDGNQKIDISNERGIDRFRSPITFNVFDETIYLAWHDIPDELYDVPFKFTNRNRKSITINTPPKSINFDLEDFIFNHVENSWNELD